jgi:hypothetical protein
MSVNPLQMNPNLMAMRHQFQAFIFHHSMHARQVDGLVESVLVSQPTKDKLPATNLDE